MTIKKLLKNDDNGDMCCIVNILLEVSENKNRIVSRQYLLTKAKDSNGIPESTFNRKIKLLESVGAIVKIVNKNRTVSYKIYRSRLK